MGIMIEKRSRGAPRKLNTVHDLCRWMASLEGGPVACAEDMRVDVVPSVVAEATELEFVFGEVGGEPLPGGVWDARAVYGLTARGEALARWGDVRVIDGGRA